MFETNKNQIRSNLAVGVHGDHQVDVGRQRGGKPAEPVSAATLRQLIQGVQQDEEAAALLRRPAQHRAEEPDQLQVRGRGDRRGRSQAARQAHLRIEMTQLLVFTINRHK